MLITLTYAPEPDAGVDATVLGHLLHKHPAKVQSFTAPVGDIQVFYPEATSERCTVAVLLEVDPVGLVRSKRFRGDAGALDHYVNDRPYVASSMLAVALGTVFRTAMTGRSDSYPELAAAPSRSGSRSRSSPHAAMRTTWCAVSSSRAAGPCPSSGSRSMRSTRTGGRRGTAV